MNTLLAHEAHHRRAKLVGSRIRLARRAKGFSQEQLAQALAGKRSQILRWEDGRQEPSPFNLERLGQELGEPLWFFFGGPPHGD